MRDKIKLNTDMNDLVAVMSEGNPGAISVLMQVMVTDPLLLLGLDDMNIRGSQVWVGYKDHCGEDIDTFKQAIRDRDPEMVHAINEECLYDNDYGSFKEVAVQHGGSWAHGGSL